MGTILYLLAMAMVAFSGGINITWFIISIGIAVIILTYFGGMEAIIWMDVIQGFLLIIGGIMAIAMLFHLTEGGASAILNIAAEHNKIDFGPYAWDFTQWCLMAFSMPYRNMVQTKVLYSDILLQELIKAQKKRHIWELC
jgi:SSS family solute:Na+ symporter